jgi:sterol desaturase/sphingolipid hydroxylase (fatty acid hydroxylase superfamily)
MSDKSCQYVSWLAYPLVTFTVVMLYGAVMVTMLEYRFPHYRQWRPQSPEVRNDLMYIAIVQMVLPKMLVFLFVIWLIDPLQQSGLMLPDYWPHHAPVWLQAILMILVADFLRYWLHVAAHKNRTLWRLHAVHHSPHRLYWLNVGRFHPLEKALQMLLDTLPFILLGVSPEVIALYFVFYAVNGFFQHSNIELRMHRTHAPESLYVHCMTPVKCKADCLACPDFAVYIRTGGVPYRNRNITRAIYNSIYAAVPWGHR